MGLSSPAQTSDQRSKNRFYSQLKMQPRDYHRISLMAGDRNNRLPEVREFRKIANLNPAMF